LQNGNVENIGINISASVSAGLQALNQLKSSLVATNQQFAQMNQHLSTMKSVSGVGATKTVSTGMKEVKSETDKATASVGNFSNRLSSLAQFTALIGFFRLIWTQIGKATKQMSDFAENFNLFTVSMGDLKDEALEFQYTMTQALSMNMSQTMRYQGFFQNLTTALGVTNDEAFVLSSTLTQLTYDMASLFNWSPDVAFQRLQAGIVGQTKPLRYAGVDVTQQTIQPILGELGINKQVKELTQAEKVLLRYIAILRQTGNAQGDFARTLESPANQFRLMNDQIKETYRWFGALFIGLLGNALPYINGFIMALKEIFKTLAMLLGFDQDDFDYFNGDQTGLPELEEDVEGADEAIKKLTGSLRKFDEINNINLSGGVIGGSFGTDSYNTLLKEALRMSENIEQSYENIRNKANDIKEEVLKWLGFTKETDEVTGEISYKMSLWGGIVVGFGALLAGSVVVGAFAKLIGLITSVGSMLGGTGILGAGLLSVNGLLLALGGVAIIGAIGLLRDKMGEVEEKVKAGSPLTGLEGIMWNIKLKTDEVVTSFQNLNKEIFGKDGDNPYAKSKWDLFIQNMHFHYMQKLNEIIDAKKQFDAIFAGDDGKPQKLNFKESPIGEFLTGVWEMLQNIIKGLDTLGVGFLEWLGLDMTGYKGGTIVPPPIAPPPPNNGSTPPPSLTPPPKDNKIVIEIDKYEVGKLYGGSTGGGTGDLVW